MNGCDAYSVLHMLISLIFRGYVILLALPLVKSQSLQMPKRNGQFFDFIYFTIDTLH